MNEKELKEYESYIEMMCKYIYYYPDFDNNIRDLTKIVDEISERLPAFQYDYYIKKNNLTYLDIINLGREVLLTIDKDLIKKYDLILKQGILAMGPKEEVEKSTFHYSIDKSNNKKLEINIRRDYNYQDVETLIHEFMHYENFVMDTLYRNALTEFFSIYYETYAIEYLITKKGIPKEEINPCNRIIEFLIDIKNISNLNPTFLSYLWFGKIDIDSINEYITNIKEEEMYKQAKKNLERIRRLKNNNYRIPGYYFNCYKYSLGTALAFYARQNVPKESIIKFYKELDNYENNMISLPELLHKYGLYLNDDFCSKTIESIEDYLQKTVPKDKYKLTLSK